MGAIAPREDGTAAESKIRGCIGLAAFVFADGVVDLCEREMKRHNLDEARHERDRRDIRRLEPDLLWPRPRLAPRSGRRIITVHHDDGRTIKALAPMKTEAVQLADHSIACEANSEFTLQGSDDNRRR